MQEFKKVGDTQVYIDDDGRFGYYNKYQHFITRKSFGEVERELTRDPATGRVKAMLLESFGLTPQTVEIKSVKKVTRGYRKYDAVTTSEGRTLEEYRPVYEYHEGILGELNALNEKREALAKQWDLVVKRAKRLTPDDIRARMKESS